MPQQNLHTLQARVEFLKAAEALKDVLRSGHTSGGRRESTAEHSWRLCLMALVLEDQLRDLDMLKVRKLCIVHDLGEAIHGDVPAVVQDGDKAAKSARERQDLLHLAAGLDASLRDHLLALYDEYEAAATPEAQAVKAMDKLETILQHTQGQQPAGIRLRLQSRLWPAVHLYARALRRAVRVDRRGNAGADGWTCAIQSA
jgi:putative hydrolase of HD superfamily